MRKFAEQVAVFHELACHLGQRQHDLFGFPASIDTLCDVGPQRRSYAEVEFQRAIARRDGGGWLIFVNFLCHGTRKPHPRPVGNRNPETGLRGKVNIFVSGLRRLSFTRSGWLTSRLELSGR